MFDFNAPHNPDQPPREPHKHRSFKVLWEEAKALLKAQPRIAVAFVFIFIALWAASQTADEIESRRIRNTISDVEEMMKGDSIAAADPMAEKQRDPEMYVPDVPLTFLERLTLRILSSIGSVLFFVFLAAALAEIAFRTYEGRVIESAEVLEALFKEHGKQLLALAGVMVGLSLPVTVLELVSEAMDSDGLMLLTVLTLIAYAFVVIRISFAVYAIIGEDLHVGRSIWRSWELTNSNFWRVLGWNVLFVLLLVLTIFGLFYLPIIAIGIFLFTALGATGLILTLLAALAWLPWLLRRIAFYFMFQMMMYAELRLRRNEDETVDFVAV